MSSATVDHIELAETRPYTLEEAAYFFGRSTRWVRRLIESGEVLGFQLDRAGGRGGLHVSGPSMNAFLRRRTVGKVAGE